MTKLPNWVDLVIVICLLITCYNGFGRGLVAELLNLAGAIFATALALNYWEVVAGWLTPWMRLDPILAKWLIFWALFVILMVLAHQLCRRLTQVVKWERLHWAIQGLGLVLGGIRGLWWAGFILLALTSSGFLYLRDSVEQESVLGPRLVILAKDQLTSVADRFPGAPRRRETLIPPAKALPKSPSEKPSR